MGRGGGVGGMWNACHQGTRTGGNSLQFTYLLVAARFESFCSTNPIPLVASSCTTPVEVLRNFGLDFSSPRRA